jgi:hypothetical protein
MKILSKRIGVAGLLCIGVGLSWMEASFYFQKRNDPPGWIVDRALPIGPQALTWLGMGLVIIAVVLGIVTIARRIIAR